MATIIDRIFESNKDFVMKYLLIILFLGFCTTLNGCGQSGSNKSDQVNDIRKTFTEYETLLNSGNYEGLLQFYADDPRFYWMENGEVKYSSLEEIASALKQLAQYGPGLFEYGEPNIILLCSDVASLSTTFKTTFGEEGKSGFSFSGALTATLIKTGSGWQFLFGHSSTHRPQGY